MRRPSPGNCAERSPAKHPQKCRRRSGAGVGAACGVSVPAPVSVALQVHLHSNLHLRQQYGPMGFNVPYKWGRGEFHNACQYVQAYITDDPVPWPALRTTIADVVYGGHVMDPLDQRCVMPCDVWKGLPHGGGVDPRRRRCPAEGQGPGDSGGHRRRGSPAPHPKPKCNGSRGSRAAVAPRQLTALGEEYRERLLHKGSAFSCFFCALKSRSLWPPGFSLAVNTGG